MSQEEGPQISSLGHGLAAQPQVLEGGGPACPLGWTWPPWYPVGFERICGASLSSSLVIGSGHSAGVWFKPWQRLGYISK